MANYEEARGKLTNTQLCKLKSAAKNNTGTTLRTTKKDFQDEELPHVLLSTARQKTKRRITFANNMTRDIKCSKAQLSEIVRLGEFLGKILDNLGKVVSSAKYFLCLN